MRMRDFLDDLQEAIETRSASEFKSEEWTDAQNVCAIAGEVGELANLVKKRWRDGNIPQEDIEDEFADVLIYMVKFATAENINIREVTIRKFNKTSLKRGYKTML